MMDWEIFTEESGESGDSWVSDTFIPRPNANMETEEISTMQKVKLSTGGNAFITPEVKYTKEPFQMFFANTTLEFRNKIRDYVRNNTKVKIIDHLSGEYIGKFTNFSRVWFSGREDAFDINATFEFVE